MRGLEGLDTIRAKAVAQAQFKDGMDESVAELGWSCFLRRNETRVPGAHPAQGWTAVLFAHGGVKISRRAMFWMGLVGFPFHEEAVDQAAE